MNKNNIKIFDKTTNITTSYNQRLTQNSAITLIALVITIIVLLILSTVTISTLFGESGIITKATEAKNATIMAEYKERLSLIFLEERTNKDLINRLKKEKDEETWLLEYECYENENEIEASNDNIEKINTILFKTNAGFELIASNIKGTMQLVSYDFKELEKITVYYDANGGTGNIDNKIIKKGLTILTSDNSNGFTKQDYDFVGWNTESNGTGNNLSQGVKFTPTENVTLYAQWSQNTYRITFNANNGTGSMEDLCVERGKETQLSSNVFSRVGYNFVGWNTKQDGTGDSFTNEQKVTPSNNIILYAQWEEIVEANLSINNNNELTVNTTIDFSSSSMVGNLKHISLRIFDDNTDITLYNESNLNSSISKTLKIEDLISKIASLNFEDNYTLELAITGNTNKIIKKTLTVKNYTISSLKNLKDFREKVNSGVSYENKTIYQINDINLNGSSSNVWTPIGKDKNIYFNGIYDGGFNKITNIYIDTQDSYQGFFGCSNGTIRNLGMYSGTMKMGNISGAVVGYNMGNVEKCYNNIGIYFYNVELAGGIVGVNKGSNAKVSQCYNNGDISGVITYDYGRIAGVAGQTQGGATVEYCYNNGDIIGTCSTATMKNPRVAGITDTSTATVKNCFNTGNLMITADTTNWKVVAGIVGQSHAATITNCFNVGKTTITNAIGTRERNGGITGYLDASNSRITNAYWLTTASPAAYFDIGNDDSSKYEFYDVDSEDEMKNKALNILGTTYFKNDSNNINKGYPILKWQ